MLILSKGTVLFSKSYTRFSISFTVCGSGCTLQYDRLYQRIHDIARGRAVVVVHHNHKVTKNNRLITKNLSKKNAYTLQCQITTNYSVWVFGKYNVYGCFKIFRTRMFWSLIILLYIYKSNPQNCRLITGWSAMIIWDTVYVSWFIVVPYLILKTFYYFCKESTRLYCILQTT